MGVCVGLFPGASGDLRLMCSWGRGQCPLQTWICCGLGVGVGVGWAWGLGSLPQEPRLEF